MRRPIALSLSPNTEFVDVFFAFKLLLNPFHFRKGKAVHQLEQWFSSYFNISKAVSFRSGRDCLYALLKAFGIGEGDEVIVQAFTCVAVPNAVVWVGAIPKYADIDDSYGIDPKQLRLKITDKTKAVIVQHTFGIPSAIGEIVEIARKKGIVVIEDCAHVIGGEYKGKKLGTFGDASFFSFGRDKAFSSVFGGIVFAKDNKVQERLLTIQKNAPLPKRLWVIQQLFHPIAFSIILPLYNILGIGKGMLFLLQKARLLSFPVSKKDKLGLQNPPLAQKYPNALCELALLQLSRLGEFNKHRKKISEYYKENLESEKLTFSFKRDTVYLRFPVLVDNKKSFLQFAKKKNILLGNWYSTPIDPKGTDLKAAYYKTGSCPVAEAFSEKVVNLPTYPTLTIKDSQKIIKLLKEYDHPSPH